MRKLITIMSYLVIALSMQATTLPASGNPNYKSLSELNYDTLAYMMCNFHENKSFYSGKTVNVLLNDMEIPIKSSFSGIKYFNGMGMCDILLYNIDYDKRTKPYMLDDKIRFKVAQAHICLKVIFENEILQSEWELWGNQLGLPDSVRWSEYGRKFFGDRIIKDIEEVGYVVPEKVIPPPAPCCAPSSK